MGNPVVHFEVVGKDGAQLRRFYGQLFDWDFEVNEQLDYGFVPPGPSIAGGVGATVPGTDGHVTFYVEVPSVDAALADAERLGGTRLWGPLQVSDDFDLELGQFTDPEGHMVGLVRSPAS